MPQNVADLLRGGGVVVYAAPETTVAEAARKMARHNVGSLLVLDRGRQLAGIFTERDLLRRIVAEGRDPEKTVLADVMTADVVIARPDMPRRDVLQLMNARNIRHVPVADEGGLLGVISLRDLLRFENLEKEFEIEQLRQYLFQTPAPGYMA